MEEGKKGRYTKEEFLEKLRSGGGDIWPEGEEEIGWFEEWVDGDKDFRIECLEALSAYSYKWSWLSAYLREGRDRGVKRWTVVFRGDRRIRLIGSDGEGVDIDLV